MSPQISGKSTLTEILNPSVRAALKEQCTVVFGERYRLSHSDWLKLIVGAED